jgi:tRNA A37 threonylcarbamoyladenosine dehydratase
VDIEKGISRRTELLLGNDITSKIASKKVILFGIGGVGSWCAESLIRSGIKHLTIVDSDRVCVTNINRQLVATTSTIGEVKVEVLKKRLLDINPYAEINAIQEVYSRETSDSFHLETYDYIIDAIDSLGNKMDLIRTATKTEAVLFSSMGAALKMDPSKIKVAEFWKVIGCPLAAALRRKFKKSEKPHKKFLCVYSEEVLENKGEQEFTESENSLYPTPQEEADQVNMELRSTKVQINGTIAHITAIFGFTLAGLVIQDICK